MVPNFLKEAQALGITKDELVKSSKEASNNEYRSQRFKEEVFKKKR